MRFLLISGFLYTGIMAREFEELAIDGQNYPTWALDIKISLASRGILNALTPPTERAQPLPDMMKYNALYIIRHHIHPDLKSEYVMEEEPSALWLSLKARYEQQKAVILPEANHEWTHIRLQDFKSIGDYNHAVHKVCAKLRFCEKEPSETDKIEKTLQTMLPSDRVLQHQYRARNYQKYSDLIHDLLQAEKHDELTVKNHHQRKVGTAPLPEVHHNEKNQKKPAGPKGTPKDSGKSKKRRHDKRKGKPNAKAPGKKPSTSKDEKCQRCGCYNHPTKKCRTARHLVDLYQSSLGKGKQAKGSGYEAHFITPSNKKDEPSSSKEPCSNESPLIPDDDMDTENALIEYTSNDVFGDLE
jgi:hypothetical protein